MGSSVNYDVENGETDKPMLGTTSSESDVLSCVRFRMIRDFVANVRKVIFGTKLLVLFPAIPMAFVAHYYSLDRVSDVHYILFLNDKFVLVILVYET
ncbi:putative calcium/proton exchanger [Helianthus annuus]|nr:putative calcium/proton exchanger [Helianthus annuus]